MQGVPFLLKDLGAEAVGFPGHNGSMLLKDTQYSGNSSIVDRLLKAGVVLFGRTTAPEGGVGIGVNAFLWRASLDTLSIWPIASADPFGGVIITDWYAPPETPNEQFKFNIFILDRSLRADGVRAMEIDDEWPRASRLHAHAHAHAHAHYAPGKEHLRNRLSTCGAELIARAVQRL